MRHVWKSSHPLWLAPHRPFFLLAGLWGFFIPMAWFVPAGLIPEPVAWHRYEFVFGMGGAAVGGYLLTALPAWTGRGPIRPKVTRFLVALWLAGRLCTITEMPPPIAAIIAAGYFFALGGYLLSAVVRMRVKEKAHLAMMPLAFGMLALLLGLERHHAQHQDLLRVSVLLFGLMMSLVGGRAIAAFTRRWLEGGERSGLLGSFSDPSWMSKGASIALLSSVLLGLADLLIPAGWLLITAGTLQLGRMRAWQSWHTIRYPALLILHLSWLWLSLGLMIVGSSYLIPVWISTATALHAVTMGAMGTMMLAMMARASMTRGSTRLLVSLKLMISYALVSVSVPVRLVVPYVEQHAQAGALSVALILWSGGWILFVWDLRKALRGPVLRPVLSMSGRPDLA